MFEIMNVLLMQMDTASASTTWKLEEFGKYVAYIM